MCTVPLYCLCVNVYCTAVLFVCKCVLYYCHRLSTQLQLNIYIYNILGQCLLRFKATYIAEPGKFLNVVLEKMEKINWTDHLRNEVLSRVKEQRNILHEISKRKANWMGHILRRNCLLRQFIEGKIKGGIEVTGRRGRRRRKLLDDLKERRGHSYLKEESLDRTM
jgi:hypothetical protein